ncbi:MAG: GNAT family N-acetyltransferase [Deltaproteobacteria bacterium]|nr:GNAT family N-acetyltransferase [Deltaproteobacteria bacterium]
MSWTKEFVELDKAIHDRAQFDCGEVELNGFIRTKAAKHMKVGISRTMLLPASVPLPDGKYPICAFYTIAPGSISRETLPKKLMKKLPRYPVPVFLLAQLAVHLKYHGQGLGKITLIKAIEYLWEINSHMRAYAIIADCLNENAEHFYSKYGFEVLCRHNGRLRMFLPMTIVRQLFQQ